MNKSYKIIIYTSDNCSFCHSAKEIFKEKKLKFEEINISKDDKLKNEKEMMVAINAVTAEFGVTMIQPFLLPNFIEYAKKIPISEKIHGPDDMQRKHSIRELAMDYGVPEVAAKKQKKALQYGSQIHKSLLKSRKTS